MVENRYRKKVKTGGLRMSRQTRLEVTSRKFTQKELDIGGRGIQRFDLIRRDNKHECGRRVQVVSSMVLRLIHP